MKQRRVTIKQVAAEAGVSITTIPSVRAPLGDFFGVGHAVAKHYVSLPLNAINESDMPIQNLFYYVDYELTDEPIPDDVGRFHAYYRQEKTQKVLHEATEENPAPWDLPGVNLTGDENYTILDAGGQRHYVGGPGAVHHVAQGLDRTWPRQRPGQRLLLSRLLVPDRQARRPRRTAPDGGQAAPALARARPLRRVSRNVESASRP